MISFIILTKPLTEVATLVRGDTLVISSSLKAFMSVLMEVIASSNP